MDLDDEELRATRKLLGLDRNKSIEEDIKKLENLIVTLPNFHLGGGDSIERILQDYKRQKQINEEHRKVNGELREKVKELEIDLTTVYIKGVEDGKDKYKKKIKEIIDECIPKKENIITKKIEYTPNANANSYLVQQILELLKESENKQ